VYTTISMDSETNQTPRTARFVLEKCMLQTPLSKTKKERGIILYYYYYNNSNSISFSLFEGELYSFAI
jgi:hypothetical protein